jgi:hypothetical protein
MSILHNQLAIYGAIDAMVLEAKQGKRGAVDQELLKTAASLMPNSTGFGQAGWYTELENFFNRKDIRRGIDRERWTFPSLDVATQGLNELPPPRSERSGAQRDTEAPGGFEQQTYYNPAYDPALARAGYGAFVLLKLGSFINWEKDNVDLAAGLRGVLATSVEAFTQLGLDEAERAMAAILERLDDADTRQAWDATVSDTVTKLYADQSKPCFGTLQEINGRYCSTVVTEATVLDLSVKDIERVVEPVNWDICSKFFCRMQKGDPRRTADGWSRVQETVGGECDEYGLTTDLIFYKVRQPDGSIFINYDIDPQRTDPGYVEVDNGYLWVSPLEAGKPGQPGVRIRTSKQEHVKGLSPCATSALACLMGWADAGKEMIAGTARDLIAAEKKGDTLQRPLKPFRPSTDDDPDEMDP